MTTSSEERLLLSMPTMPSDVSIGTPLQKGDLVAGKYRVDRLIGEGGMGAVLRATHVDLERTVAIKIVRQDLGERPELVERLLLEARALAHLSSEHVARVLDVGKLDANTPYIVMEYLEGADLGFVLLEHGALTIPLAVDFIVQACEAVAEAHANGIVHRDLKPENLFLTHRVDGAPIIKVLDFGISKHMQSSGRALQLTNPSGGVGSPNYMAPEQMRSAVDVDARADIWSLGAILFELITGSTPFSADSLPTVCAMVLSEEPPRPRELNPAIPDALETIVLRCLRKDRAARYNDVADLAAALAPFGSEGTRHYVERVQGVLTHHRSTPSLLIQSANGLPFPPRRSLAPSTLTLAHESTHDALAARRAKPKQRRRAVYIGAGLLVALLGTGLMWAATHAPPSVLNRGAANLAEADKSAPRPEPAPSVQREQAPAATTRGPEVSVVDGALPSPSSGPAPIAKKTRTIRDIIALELARDNVGRDAGVPAPRSSARGAGSANKRDAWDESNFGGRR